MSAAELVHMMREVGLDAIGTMCRLDRRALNSAKITNVWAGVTCDACREAIAKEGKP